MSKRSAATSICRAVRGVRVAATIPLAAADGHPADEGAIKILLVDDHPIVRQGYRRLLECVVGFRVVGEAGEAAAAYDAFRRTEPDVVVMDISMPGASELEATRHIRQWDPRAQSRFLDALHGSPGAQGFRSRRQRYVPER